MACVLCEAGRVAANAAVTWSPIDASAENGPMARLVDGTSENPQMPMTIGMHEASYAHIKQRLDTLALGVDVVTFNSDGRCRSCWDASWPKPPR